MYKKITLASVALFVAVLTFFVGSNLGMAASVDIVIETVNQYGGQVPGRLSVPGYFANDSLSPQTAVNVPEGTYLSVSGGYHGLSMGLMSVKASLDTTARVDVRTRTVTYVPTPGVNKIQFVFNIIPSVEISAVDDLENPLRAFLYAYSIGSGGVHVPSGFISPQNALDIPEGAYISMQVSYGGLTTQYGLRAIEKDTTYKINALTKTMVATQTPGVSKIIFVFNLISSIEVSTVDGDGNELAGYLYAYAIGGQGVYINPGSISPQNALNFPIGGYLSLQASYGGLTTQYGLRAIEKDTTYKINALNKSVIAESTPGVSKIQFVFDSIPSIEVSTVDGEGNALAGYLYAYAIGGQGVYINPGSISPQNALDFPTGGYLSLQASYGGLTTSYNLGNIQKDTTYTINALTRAMTSASTPGVNKIQFVFDLIPAIELSTVGLAEKNIDGTVHAYTFGNGAKQYVPQGSPSPQSIFNAPEGASIRMGGTYGEISSGYFSVIAKRDTTTTINIETGELVVSETPGINKVQFELDVNPSGKIKKSKDDKKETSMLDNPLEDEVVIETPVGPLKTFSLWAMIKKAFGASSEVAR